MKWQSLLSLFLLFISQAPYKSAANTQTDGTDTRCELLVSNSSRDSFNLVEANQRRQEGVAFANMWIKTRMGGRSKVQPDVLEVIQFGVDINADAFSIGSRGGHFLIQNSTSDELYRIMTDADFAAGVAETFKTRIKRQTWAWLWRSFPRGLEKREISGELFQKLARMFFAYKYVRELPRTDLHYTMAEFAKIAEIEGIKIERFNSLYRIDSREAADIVQQEGFYPNPSRKRGILSDHSSPLMGSHGAGFVSTSSESGQIKNLSVWPIFEAAKIHSTDPKIIDQMFPTIGQISPDKKLRAVMGRSNEKTETRLEILKTYEYGIVDVLGAYPSEQTSIVTEKEIVVPFVSLDHIQKVRDIFILAEVRRNKSGTLHNYVIRNSTFGDWVTIVVP